FLSSGRKFEHPSLSIDISNDHCFGCHSRSGRISTNYEGWHETHKTPDEVRGRPGYRTLEDGRVFAAMPADVHHESGLLCIDCHTSYEVMGDGKLYEHKEQQIEARCEDCHSRRPSETIRKEELDFESRMIVELRGYDENNEYIRLKNSGRPLVNVIQRNNNKYLFAKSKDTIYNMLAPARVCGTNIAGHNRLSCKSCHSDWSPQCIGCHTEYDPAESGFDHLTGIEKQGGWVEYDGEYLASPPVLGVFGDRVETFVPGMVMTIDKSRFDGSSAEEIFIRLYAPAFSHTIRREGRSCRSCHNSSLAIGYGRGELTYSADEGKWSFAQYYANNPNDGLPEDAFTGFLRDRTGITATRADARAFAIEEQRRILLVGSCLECHSESDEKLIRHFESNPEYWRNISPECRLPEWHNK
ncbi:MAG: hypothetical protein ACLFQX_11060, partial [Candidatus Kapaibacterium sp.]